MKEWLLKYKKLSPLLRRVVMGLILFPPLVAVTKYDSLRKVTEVKPAKVKATSLGKNLGKKAKKAATPQLPSISDPDPKP